MTLPPGWCEVGQTGAMSTRWRVGLAGRVRDAVTQAPIAGAVVEVVGDTACTLSRADGLFWFPGPVGNASTVTLRVQTPQLGTRYGTVEQSVSLTALPRTVWDADVALPPTCLRGTVQDPQGKPVVGAEVRLCGDAQTVRTDKEGKYILVPLVASQPTVEVSAPQFVMGRSTLSAPLQVGKETVMDMILTPAKAS